MVETPPERWRPPLLPNPAAGKFERSLAPLRRFFDIQAGSVWRDLAAVLPDVRGRVLDVGSGAQPYRPLVHPDATYMAIDTEAAKPHFGYEAPDTRYFRGDVWPVEDASIDFIICTETLEHVLDTKQFLGEASRSLRAGGTICSLSLSQLDGTLFLTTTGASRRLAWITYYGKPDLPAFVSMPEGIQERWRVTKSWH